MSKLLLSLAWLIRRIRMEKSMHQKDLAKNVGVSTMTVGHIERGDRWPSMENFVKIAIELEEEPGALLQRAYEDSLTVRKK